MSHIESAGLTDVGRKRKANQDTFIIDEALGLFVVADGMGGHRAGEVASRVVAESLHRMMSGEVPRSRREDADTSVSSAANELLFAIKRANRDVFDKSRDNAAYQGMGSTVSAVFFTDKTFIAANVGDSPIYLVHQGRIERISELHTLMAEHALKDPEGKSPLDPGFRHVLTRAMGIAADVIPGICEVQYFKGDILVLASDGLSDKVSPEEICRVVMAEAPGDACRHLVDLANQRGGDDNITVVVVKIKNSRTRLGGLLARWFKKKCVAGS